MGTAAARASESERQQFAEIAARMKTAQRTHDFDAFARLDAEFNRLCVAACRNEFAGSMMQAITPLNRRFWFIASWPDAAQGRRGGPHRDRASFVAGQRGGRAVRNRAAASLYRKPRRPEQCDRLRHESSCASARSLLAALEDGHAGGGIEVDLGCLRQARHRHVEADREDRFRRSPAR